MLFEGIKRTTNVLVALFEHFLHLPTAVKAIDTVAGECASANLLSSESIGSIVLVPPPLRWARKRNMPLLKSVCAHSFSR